MKVVVFTLAAFPVAGALVQQVREVAAAEVVVVDEKAAALAAVAAADVLLCFHSNYDDGLLAAGKRLKWIHSLSAGVDTMLTDRMMASGVLLTDSSGVHRIPIAEHVLGAMVLHARQFAKAVSQRERGEWVQDFKVDELAGKRVVVVGLGSIGKRVAKLCRAFDMDVAGVKRTKAAVEGVDAVFTTAELACVLPGADYVVNILPLTGETFHFFGRDEFALMNGAYFINVGRGRTVDEAALAEALSRGLLAGAALDVFEEEPLPEASPFWKMEAVFITPHVAGWTPAYMERAVSIFCENMAAFLSGKALPNLVDRKRGY